MGADVIFCSCGRPAERYRRSCPACRKRDYNLKNPFHYVWQNLKYNAKRRGHEFLLTLEEFKLFCARTGYMELRGKTQDSMSIDRIDENRGYSLDNIQMITLRENSLKQAKTKRWKSISKFEIDNGEAPF